jgi:hypothetical protein
MLQGMGSLPQSSAASADQHKSLLKITWVLSKLLATNTVMFLLKGTEE